MPHTASGPTLASRLRRWLFAAAALALPALPATAQTTIDSLGLTVTVTPTIASDYLFRGISQTRNNWAFQGALDVQHESGVYIGGFISNAKFLAGPYNDTRQEVDALAGYRFELAGISFDLGYIGYFYPGQSKPGGTQLNEYHEVSLKAAYTIDPVKLLAAFNYSPNFFGRSGEGYYVEGGADVTLPLEFTASARVGYQWIQRNTASDGSRYFGAPDYLWYSIGISREITGGVVASLGWYGTTIKRADCFAVAERADQGQRVCEGRVLFTVSRIF
ncbi:TorF family putative porin [Siccirubricoccus phaeus]|uniref:TorF family putative porin n=1 Tax=Siccirubricoccus phaeus TaxID=2595053 RepID=UPI0011F2A15E|nr:TorF family putative porin [Siccirubricoccus phaeus]